MRRIIHVDMDAFFASVEQRDDETLRGKPVAVGGSSRRGVVAAASYEARRYGVRSAMPSARAHRLCPDLVFVKPRFEAYSSVSRQIREIFGRYTDLVEPLSLDEAYLDVTLPKIDAGGEGLEAGERIARRIKNEIRNDTGLTASAGVSFNKFLAKMASDVKKPDGLFTIGPEGASAFLAALPVERFHGVGRATAEKMKEIGIYTGADLMTRSLNDLEMRFGKMGHFFYRMVRGEDYREVRADRIRKSVGAERTFPRDMRKLPDMEERVGEIAQHVAERMSRIGVAGRTVTLKIKYHDFSLTTRSTTVHFDVSSGTDLQALAVKLLHEPKPHRPVRLLGVAVSNLRLISGEKGAVQLTLSLE